MGLWAKLTGARRKTTAQASPDVRFGSGLWRQHHDRFMRAVDRFYTTAVALRADAQTLRESEAAEAATEAVEAATVAAETIAQQTLVLNDLATRIGALSAACHARFPLHHLVLPAAVRMEVGALPELVSRAAVKVSEACQAAAMARVAVRTGSDPLAAADSARAYAADAARVVAQCESALPRDLATGPGTGAAGPGTGSAA